MLERILYIINKVWYRDNLIVENSFCEPEPNDTFMTVIQTSWKDNKGKGTQVAKFKVKFKAITPYQFGKNYGI